ncbi:hypothetical protein BDF14DRAFT_1849966 [Spinellus fusiger]|nr:hypothetical protein BDF14DRAFT_1849966 [Spinellus fusiger]
MSESSPELSPFDQELSDLSDDNLPKNSDYSLEKAPKLSLVPSSAATTSQAPLKIKLRLNPSAVVLTDDDKGKKKKHKKKKAHKKHKKARHTSDPAGEERQDSNDHHDKQRRESEQVNIDDDDDDDESGRESTPQTSHPSMGGKRPFAMLQTETQKASRAEVQETTNEQGQGHPSTPTVPTKKTHSSSGGLKDYSEGLEGKSEERHGNIAHQDRKPSDVYPAVCHPTEPLPKHTHRHSHQQQQQQTSPLPQTPTPTPTPTQAQPQAPHQHPHSKAEGQAKKRGRPLKSKVAPPPLQRIQEQPRKDMKTVCLKLLETFEKRDAYGFFLEPVDTRLIVDYLSVIKRPMDFSTMRQKIESGRYRHLDEFKQDFLLIVTNAKTYNAPGTIYWKTADRLEHFGLKSLERVEPTVSYDPPARDTATDQKERDEEETATGTSKYKHKHNSWTRKLSSVSLASYKKEPHAASHVKIEEEVDILGLDGTLPLRKHSRQASESLAEGAHDYAYARGMTPLREPKKKKKKKMNEAGVIYAPDGSLNAVGGVHDLNSLLPMERCFADPPQLTTVNPQALPSAFYQSRNAPDDWTSNKHLIHPAHFCDYGPFTTLGVQTPGAFYTAQDASYIYPLYGDDRGEAYMKSIWDFAEGLELHQNRVTTARYLTRGAWDVVEQVLVAENRQQVETEFGTVDVPGIMEDIQKEDKEMSYSQSSSSPPSPLPIV